MRRLLLALSSAFLLLSPTAAFAAFETPGQLFTALQNDARAKSFSFTAHGGSQGTFVSVWANGKLQGGQADLRSLSMKATLDMVQGSTKIRIKGEVLVLRETLYLEILSVQGAPKDAAGILAQQKQWISVPLGQNTVEGVQSGLDIGFLSADMAALDSQFVLGTYQSKGLTVYTLSLTPDFAIEIAQQLRRLLNDTQPVSNDFLPWRALGESVKFAMTIVLTGSDRFVSSTFSLSMKTKFSEFSVKGSEQALSSPLVLTPPADATPISTPSGFESSEIPQEPSSVTEPSEPPSESACTDPTVSPVKFLELQRSGVCPTKKVPTRYGGW